MQDSTYKVYHIGLLNQQPTKREKNRVIEAHSSKSHITHTLVRGRGSNSFGQQEQFNPLLLIIVRTPLFQGIYAVKSFEQT